MRVVRTFFFLLLAAVPSWAQLCPGDSPSNISITSNTASVFRVQIWGRTRLNHGSNHPGCSGTVKVNPQLWLDSSYMSCQTGVVSAPGSIATNGSTNHERVAYRYCTTALCAQYYLTRSPHYFDSLLGYSDGNYASAGNCSGAHCAPCTPGYVPGDCGFSEQDECGCCSSRPVCVHWLSKTGKPRNGTGGVTGFGSWPSMDPRSMSSQYGKCPIRTRKARPSIQVRRTWRREGGGVSAPCYSPLRPIRNSMRLASVWRGLNVTRPPRASSMSPSAK